MEKGLPPITDELIEGLSRAFPQRHPDLSMSDKQIWYVAGKRFVVEYVIDLQKRQKETMLSTSLLES